MIYHVTVGSRTLEVDLDADGIRIDGKTVSADIAHVEGTAIHSLIIDGESHRIVAGGRGSGLWDVVLRGRRFKTEVLDERTRAIRELTAAHAGPVGPAPVRAPMPGLVVKIEVEVGDVVEAGQGVAIVEAMKMENELTAQGAGRVRAITVAEGDTVTKDQILVDLEPLESEAPEA